MEKYDASVGVMVGLMRYGSGMPFHRLERLQKSLGVPLPASVQWEQVDRVSESLEPVFEHLVNVAAQAPVLYSDDTGMRVRSLREEIQGEKDPKRTGIFTSGIVGKLEDYCVNLYFTGRSHAGRTSPKCSITGTPGDQPRCTCAMDWLRTTPKDIPQSRRSAMCTRGETLWNWKAPFPGNAEEWWNAFRRSTGWKPRSGLPGSPRKSGSGNTRLAADR